MLLLTVRMIIFKAQAYLRGAACLSAVMVASCLGRGRGTELPEWLLP